MKEKPPVTVLQFFDALAESGVLKGETWMPWRAFLGALFGLPLSAEEAALAAQCTGRADLPAAAFSEGWLVCGRRSGKSFVLALVAVFLACFRDFRAHLGPGERATIMVIATDRKQARTIYRFALALLTIPQLARLVTRKTSEQIHLSTGAAIEIHTATFRRTRGYAIAAALLDELAFWPTDEWNAEPDREVLDAVRAGMAQFPNARPHCASSPYERKGALWEAFRARHGKDGEPVLVWKAATRTMNATVPQATIDAALKRDEAWARAEFFAEFRDDISLFVPFETVAACLGEHAEMEPEAKRRYFAFVDPAGGSGGDSMALAIAHREGERAVVDLVREVKPPFSPEDAINQFVLALRPYRIKEVVGDRFGGEFPREMFRRRGISSALAQKVRSLGLRRRAGRPCARSRQAGVSRGGSICGICSRGREVCLSRLKKPICARSTLSTSMSSVSRRRVQASATPKRASSITR